jgi:hypothetical protein
VDRIELIRGQVREIDLRGQANLINVVLKGGTDATIKWETFIRRTFGFGKLTPGASISLADSWAGMDYSVGFSGRRAYVGRDGTEDIFDGDGTLVEHRVVGRDNRNTFYKGNFDASRWLGETFLRFNANFTLADHVHTSFSDRNPVDPAEPPQYQFIDRRADEPFFELGFDMERSLNPDLFGKFIGLFYRKYLDDLEIQTLTNGIGQTTLLQTAETYNVATEAVSRLELDWSGFDNHAVQLNMEAAFNQLDGKFSQHDDTGLGPLAVFVPGANSTVEEMRGDVVLQDTWSLGRFELEYGLGGCADTVTFDP